MPVWPVPDATAYTRRVRNADQTNMHSEQRIGHEDRMDQEAFDDFVSPPQAGRRRRHDVLGRS